ncbi:MAG: DUF3108 domain-containing protein [Wenzhouxiangella sp.]|nr:MAG: DUF3108 domain-containing protein [Wenzhouxiangella sp.]
MNRFFSTINRWLSLCCLAVTSMIMAGAQAETTSNRGDAPLPAHSAVYDVLRRGSKIGEIHVSLSHDERGIWHFDTETVATARLARMLRVSAEESAHFVWEGDRVRMLTYRQVTRGPTRSRFWQHELDWSERVSRTHTYDGDHLIELEDDMLDPLTLRLQLAVALADPDQRGNDLSFRVLERDEIEDQQFLFQAREQLKLDMGCFDSLRMQRFRREGSSRNYDSWHSEAFHWMPLRIVQIDDGREELEVRLVETSLEMESNCGV